MAVIPRIPKPDRIVVDPKTGTISPLWWRFFHDLMQRTGGVGSLTILFQSDVGSVVQAWDAELDAIAALSPTDSNFIVGNGTTWVAESGATVRASLGLVIGTDVIADVLSDITPQLGGDLDVNGNSIVSASNGDIAITPNGTGDVIIDGLKHPQADGTNTQIIQTDGAGQLSFVDKPAGSGDALPIADTTNIVKGGTDATKQIRMEADTNITTGTTRVITMADQDIDLTPGSGSYIKDIVSDTTPQLGGDLDLNGNNIDFPTTPNISDCLDEDNMVSDSATALATQQSIKKYVDDNSGGAPTLATEQAASGTSVDFTSIPAGTKRIVVQFVGVSQDSGTNTDIIVQLGDAGGIETTGYLGAASTIDTTVSTENMTAGLPVRSNIQAAGVIHGTLTLTLEDATAFTWVASGVMAHSNSAIMVVSAGSKSLSAELTQLRITTVAGTASFDAGAFNILYE